MPSPVTCRTLCNRLSKCYYFKERDGYRKSAELIFKRLLELYASDPSSSIVKLFCDEFNRRSYTGDRLVYKNDREYFKEHCIRWSSSLDSFISKFDLTNILSSYCYKTKIKGYIDGQIKRGTVNVSFSYKNAANTHKDLDFFGLNNYIYNQVHELDNDCIVMSIPTNSFYLIEYDYRDYTIKRGFLTSILQSRSRARGEHCKECQKVCKSEFINGLERLEGIL